LRGLISNPAAAGNAASASKRGTLVSSGFPNRTTAEDDFRLLADNVPAMIWRARPDGRCDWFNRPWLAFTGRSLAQELEDCGIGSVHPEDAGSRQKTHCAFERQEEFSIAYRLRRHDGVYRWVLEHAKPYYSPDGKFAGYFGSCVDITEQRQRESRFAELASEREAAAKGAFHETQQYFQILVNSVVDYAIFMLDPAGKVVNWNPGAERIKGYSAAEIIGEHFSRFYTPEDLASGLPARALSIARREGKFENEGWRVRKDGSRFFASVVIDPVYDENGVFRGYAKITRDMTQRREAEAQLEEAREHLMQAQKMEAVGQLTGGVAHDFNNLLTIILGNLEAVERTLANWKEGSQARIGRLVQNAMQGGKRAAALTSHLLAFSRRQPLNPKPLNVNRLLNGLADFLRRTLGEQTEIETIGAGGLWRVEVDAVQLETAILNIALNARDAMQEGGKLTIEASNTYLDEEYSRRHTELKPGQYVLLAISDNGTGMEPDVLARAFDPFFTTKPAGVGTGLGLSQVYGFVKQSGGHVKVYSELGHGTTVKLYLPRFVGSEEASDDPPYSAQTSEGYETILVVEDDHEVRSFIVETLRDLKYGVLQASNGEAALQVLAAGLRPHLLLTDVIMPGLNGRELADRARAMVPGLQILYMTGYSRNAIVHHGRLDPGVELLQKPTTHDVLAAKLRALLDPAA
jgi:PAS domain S-box-containing protein